MAKMSDSRIIIIGGGTGGTILTNLLSWKIGNKASITLVSDKDKVLYEPDNLFRLFDTKSIDGQYRPLRKLIHKRAELIIDPVIRVDPNSRKVFTKENRELDYDYLVIASGASYDYDRVPGYRDAAYNFHAPDEVLRLREALKNFEEGDLLTGIADLPFKCPVSPLEFVFMAHHYFKKRKMLDKVRFHYASPLSTAFSIENVNKKVEKKFEKLGINLHTFFNTESIDPQKKIVTSLEGDELPYDLLVMVPPHRGQDYIIKSGLGDEDGWVPVDKETLLHENYDNIYAIGDATNLPISKSGSASHHSAKIVAHSITRRIRNKKPLKRYNGHVQCFLMTSLTSSIFLDFNYYHPPKWFGLMPGLGSFWYIGKRVFPFFFFRLILKGRV